MENKQKKEPTRNKPELSDCGHKKEAMVPTHVITLSIHHAQEVTRQLFSSVVKRFCQPPTS